MEHIGSSTNTNTLNNTGFKLFAYYICFCCVFLGIFQALFGSNAGDHTHDKQRRASHEAAQNSSSASHSQTAACQRSATKERKCSIGSSCTAECADSSSGRCRCKGCSSTICTQRSQCATCSAGDGAGSQRSGKMPKFTDLIKSGFVHVEFA